MATGPRSKAASSCNNERPWSVREALPAGLIACLLANLTLLHYCTRRIEDSSRGEPDAAPSLANRPLVDDARSTARTTLQQAVESAEPNFSVEQLRLAVTDSDATVRLGAVAALADVDDEQASKVLAMTALYDHYVAVRQEAINALSERRGAADLQALEQTLMDSDGRVREAAIEAFVTIGGDQAAQALSVLLDVGDVSSRRQAVDALGEIGGDIAVAELHQALMDGDSTVRESASELLTEPR